MKKLILTILLLAGIFLLHSLNLANYYQKNYGNADRSVFVFNSKPSYEIDEQTNSIQITIRNCKLNSNISDQSIKDNSVLESYSLFESQGNVIINIYLNREEETTRKFGLDHFLLKEDVYKLVLDIFKYDVPKDQAEFNCYISFYERVEMKKNVVKYKEMLQNFLLEQESLLQEEEIPFEKITEDDAEENEQVTTEWDDNIADYFKKLGFFNILIISLFLIAVILFVIVIIIFRNSKRSRNLFNREDKLGSRNFRIKVVKILKESGWEDKAIASELGISLEEVKDFSKQNS